MHLKYLKSIFPPNDSIVRVTAVCFSPNSTKLAAVTSNRVVYIFVENGEQKDNFTTKAADGKVSQFSF
jgi:intraflagellar transport protein 172